MSAVATTKKTKTGLPPSQIQQASAGTGKTFALSSRYLQLILAGVDPATILATTFTRAAAGEILDRIVGRLALAAGDEKRCEELAGQLGVPLTREQAVMHLASLMRQIHLLQVGTIDSFFYRLARAASFELGLPAGWELTDGDQLATARDRAVQQVLAHGLAGSLLNLISHTEADRKISSAMDRVIDDHYDLFQQAPVSAWELDEMGTVKPPGEAEIAALAERMAALEVGDGRLKKTVDTDQALLAEGNLLKLAEQTLVCKAAGCDFEYYKKPLPPEVIEVYRDAVGLCRAAVLAFNVQRNRSMFQLLELYANNFREFQRQQGMLGFADVTRLLENMVGDGGAKLTGRLDGEIDHLLLDEFQDTSSQQWTVIAPFSRGVVQPAKTGSFFCVGDVKQSIYGWRGGVSEMFDVVRQDLGSAVGEAEPLVASRRSAPAVIELVNQVFANLNLVATRDEIERASIDEWCEGFERHTTVHGLMTGSARIVQASAAEPGSKISATENAEAVDAATIEAIQRITEATDLTVGVLVRKHDDAARLIFRLRQLNIPCSEEGGNPLTDSVAVNVILAAFQLADHPADSIAGYLLSHSPLGKQLGFEPYVTPKNEAFVLACHRAARSLRERLQIDGYGATCLWLARTLFDKATERERLRIELLVNQATEFDLQWSPRPGDFVRRISKLNMTDPTAARVRVMTIHRSKGLEFGAVVAPMYGGQNGWSPMTPATVYSRDPQTRQINRIMRYVGAGSRALLPDDLRAIFSAHEAWQVREALCVLYVTLTRAVRDLTVVVGPKARADHSSPEGVLLTTLGTGSSDSSVVYQAGDANWFQTTLENDSKPETNNVDAQFQLPEGPVPKLVLLNEKVRSGRGDMWQRPSEHDSGHSRTGAQLLRLSRLEQAHVASATTGPTARERGIILHEMYQEIEWIDGKTRLPDSIQQSQNLFAEFKRQIAQPTTASLLNRTSYLDYVRTNILPRDHTLLEALSVQVQNEFGVVARVGTRMLEGFIDRLVLISEGSRLIAAEIIDFKTDELPAEAARKQSCYYESQLQQYRAGLAVQLGLAQTQIHYQLAFVHPDVVIQGRLHR